LRHRAERLDKAAEKIMALHKAQDKQSNDDALEPKRQAQMEALRKEAARTREFLASSAKRKNRKGEELKTNVTDPESAKMATSKGVIQGYAAQAAVDSSHQIIVAADVLITADAGYHSDANIKQLKDNNIPALIADYQMTSSGTIYISSRGLHYQTYAAKEVDCNACKLSKQCLKGPLKPNNGRGRQVTRFVPKPKDLTHPSERMRQAIDSPRGRQLYSQRMGTVEPVFANIRHNKRLTRLNHRGRAKVNHAVEPVLHGAQH
jgi:hypothetical protein